MFYLLKQVQFWGVMFEQAFSPFLGVPMVFRKVDYCHIVFYFFADELSLFLWLCFQRVLS